MNSSPRPFTSLLPLALKAETALRRLIVVDELFQSGCRSLSAVAETTSTPTRSFSFSLATIRAIPRDEDLTRLLVRSFGRPVLLYRNPIHKNGPIPGLTEDGKVAAEMARVFLAELDS